MPFGLRNAAQTFQRFMDQVLHGIPSMYVYLDDVLIASTTPEQHYKDLKAVFTRLSAQGILCLPLPHSTSWDIPLIAMVFLVFLRKINLLKISHHHKFKNHFVSSWHL